MCVACLRFGNVSVVVCLRVTFVWLFVCVCLFACVFVCVSNVCSCCVLCYCEFVLL